MPRPILKIGHLNHWVIALFLGIQGFPQSTEINSHKDQLKSLGKDSLTVAYYYEYGSTFENSLPDTAMYYYNMARNLSTEIKYRKGEASYASHAIEILNDQGKFRESLDLTLEALRIYEEIGTVKDLAIANLNVGSEWQYLSDFQLAAEYYLKAMKLAEEIGDKRLQRITNNNLASIFINLKEYVKGLDYANKSLIIAKELKNEYAISSSTLNIATAQLYLKEYDNALANYSEIEKIGLQINDFEVILDGWLGMADVFSAKKSIPQALDYYMKVIDFSKEKLALEYEMYAYMGISDAYVYLEDYDEAEKFIWKGIDLAQKLGSKYELKDLYLRASGLKEKTKDFQKALEYYKQYETLNDSIIGEKSITNINLLEAKFDSEKKETMINNLETEKKINQLAIQQKSSLNYLLIGAIVMVVVISFLAFRNYSHKQKLNQQRINELEKEKQLTATEAVLKGEEQERTRLAKDLHDGLGGMLSGIKYSFQTMKSDLIMTPDNQKAFARSMDMLDSSIQEMRRVAHNLMPESLVRFGLDIALEDYCKGINKSGALQINYQSIGLKDHKFEQTTAITIYRIIQELIGNTLKHAAAKNAIVQVTKSDNLLTITVEDDGKGFDIRLLNKSKGMGWINIKHRVDFLKGKLDVNSKEGNGTSVHIEFEI
ncbi:hypothetical protein H4O18_11110 [Arenibacter sp. BSSL-BM3]|uniref:histidine kinase n=1 Tax=Arenibacter arenosicollis TaxID=2762274 RepID=A0ABR7QNP3_9FLAO|nr:ATP-binding protein [Arenibacter arenosicollis]MBC8768542.1 hypothetical protein [Arenibacter arenosicollis]